MRCPSRCLITVCVLVISFPASLTLAQIPPEALDLLEQAQQGTLGAYGMNPIEPVAGTWVYPARGGTHTRMLEDQTFKDARGVDAEFMAKASVHLTQTKRGPDLCNPGEQGVSEFRLIAMQPRTGSGPFLAGGQLSRLIVNQQEERAVLYLRGDVREWVPGPEFCGGEKQMIEASSGTGLLRLEYRTQGHLTPLHFTAYPRSWEVDQVDFEAACDRFEALAERMYGLMHQRWNLLTNDYNLPLDWSQISSPPVPEGFNNGEEGSFGDGTFSYRDIVTGVADTITTLGLAEAVQPFFEKAPKLLKGSYGLVHWGLQYAVAQVGGQMIDTDVVPHMLEMIKAMNKAYSGEPAAREVAGYAQGRVSDGDHEFSGVKTDYMIHTVLDACQNFQTDNPPEGYAAGHFSWAGGTIPLIGRGAVGGAPAAMATGPVQSTPSLADALALAEKMAGSEAVNAAEIEAALPEGFSLEELPIAMTGQAGSGAQTAPGMQEWTLSYTIELVDDGEKIADQWFDPRR